MMEIRARLARSSGVDASLIAHLDRHTHELRLLDRQLGASTNLDAISAHIKTVHDLMTHTILTKDRQALARIIADAAALAAGKPWTPGQRSEPGLLRYCPRTRVRSGRPHRPRPRPREQSFALADLGHHEQAVALLDEASALPRTCVNACWLAPPTPKCAPTAVTITKRPSPALTRPSRSYRGAWSKRVRAS